MDGNKAEVKENPVPAELESKVREAAENCPVSAIIVE
jgi:ferredoxin